MNSVCMATYNGSRYLREQLDSILSQIAIDDEVVISDDGSTDDTCSIIGSYSDSRIRLLHHSGHNYVLNFEYCLRHSKGDIIFLSDQDDVWLPHKYVTCLDALREVDLVCTNAIVTDDSLHPLCADFFTYHHSRGGIFYTLFNNSYSGNCMAFRRSLLRYALPIHVTCDGWLGLVAEVIGSTLFISTPCIYYRRHSDAVSTNCHDMSCHPNYFTRSNRPLYVKLLTRFQQLYYLVRFYIHYHLC